MIRLYALILGGGGHRVSLHQKRIGALKFPPMSYSVLQGRAVATLPTSIRSDAERVVVDDDGVVFVGRKGSSAKRSTCQNATSG
jgi:hypothetical protein